MAKDNEIVPLPNVEVINDSEVPQLLRDIRPLWRAKNLIKRVERLLKVDPSSACQRLLNAAIHDLREKIIIAGIDIASEAAEQNKLPPIQNAESIENYSTSNLIDLSYKIGLLTRPEWRRLSRCYEIRRDLEHEDDEYEAGIEDCIYIFKTCIEVVLSRDPIQLLKITDVKEIVEQGEKVTPADTLLQDYNSAPEPRQEEIAKFLISYALNSEQPEIVQQNAFICLQRFSPLTQDKVKLSLAKHFQKQIGRKSLNQRQARVACAIDIFPYLRSAQRKEVFERIYEQMQKVGSHWSSHNQHGELLRSFKELGGLQYCPETIRSEILRWLVVTYIGVPGGRTRYGNIRHVFFSDTAAPIIINLIKDSKDIIAEDLYELKKDQRIKKKCKNTHVARRFENLLDIVDISDLED